MNTSPSLSHKTFLIIKSGKIVISSRLSLRLFFLLVNREQNVTLTTTTNSCKQYKQNIWFCTLSQALIMQFNYSVIDSAGMVQWARELVTCRREKRAECATCTNRSFSTASFGCETHSAKPQTKPIRKTQHLQQIQQTMICNVCMCLLIYAS